MIRISKLAGAMLLGAGAIALSGCATGLHDPGFALPADAGPGWSDFLCRARRRPTGQPRIRPQRDHRRPAARSPRLSSGGCAAGGGHAGHARLWSRSGQDRSRRRPFAHSRLPRIRTGAPSTDGPITRDSAIGGRRSPFYYGWDDPLWYRSGYFGCGGGYYRGAIRSYTVYKSFLDMDIVRRADNGQLFQGHVKARSQTDELGALVPNLVEAMFTDFPGEAARRSRSPSRPARAEQLFERRRECKRSGPIPDAIRVEPLLSAIGGRIAPPGAPSPGRPTPPPVSLRAGGSAGGCRHPARHRWRATSRSA